MIPRPSNILKLKVRQSSALLFSTGNINDLFSPENKKRTIDALLNHHSGNPVSKIEHFIGGQFKKSAAILVPLCYDIENRPAILFNLRSTNLKSHRGQISFPGGSVDSQDKDDLIVTALRETEEELGIPRSQVDVWTILPYVPTVTSLMRVGPVLAFIKDPFDPKLLPVNPDEVEFAFTVPIEHLVNKDNWGVSNYTQNCQKFSTPEFRNLKKFMATEKRIVLWGLTALVTHVVLLTLAPNIYQRDIVITRGIKPGSSEN